MVNAGCCKCFRDETGLIEFQGASEMDYWMNQIWSVLEQPSTMWKRITCIHPIKDIVRSFIALQEVLANNCRYALRVDFFFFFFFFFLFFLLLLLSSVTSLFH